MSIKVIAIAGVKGVGKDTVAQFIIDNFGAKQYALAYPIKTFWRALGVSHEMLNDRVLKESHNEDYGKTNRKLMTDFGDLVLGWNLEIFVKGLILTARNDGSTLVVVSDLRLPSELNALLNNKYVQDVKVLKVVMDKSDTSKETHKTETSIPLLPHDAIIHNDGSLDELRDNTIAKVCNFGWKRVKYNPEMFIYDAVRNFIQWLQK